MSIARIVGFSGNLARPSKTLTFVDHVVTDIARLTGLPGRTFDIEDLGPSLPAARRAADLDAQALRVLGAIIDADALVVGSPTYKGSYTGLFKHLFDLIDPAALRGKPVVLTATGGGDRHALMVEHALRPLFGFLEAFTLPTAVYAAERDFLDSKPAAEPLLKRAAQAAREVELAISLRGATAIAAE